MRTESDIARISDRLVGAYAPLEVGTFGSYAVGTERTKRPGFVGNQKFTPTSFHSGARGAASSVLGGRGKDTCPIVTAPSRAEIATSFESDGGSEMSL